ncbi:MAG: hypothetical protein PHO63_05565 [Bacilli bacterium]|nr:hypothetical protein [Bacilli bacterium]
MENKEELKQYYADLRKGIGLEKEDEKILTSEERELWEKYVKEMRTLKNKIEGISQRYIDDDKIEIRILSNERK